MGIYKLCVVYLLLKRAVQQYNKTDRRIKSQYKDRNHYTGWPKEILLSNDLDKNGLKLVCYFKYLIGKKSLGDEISIDHTFSLTIFLPTIHFYRPISTFYRAV